MENRKKIHGNEIKLQVGLEAERPSKVTFLLLLNPTLPSKPTALLKTTDFSKRETGS